MSKETTTPGQPGEECIRSGDKHDVLEDGYVRLRPRTHDISFTENHIPDIQQLGADLDAAVKAAWPKRHDTRYSQVHVLLISWIDDDLGVSEEIKALRHVFRDRYNFQVQQCEIPSTKPDRGLKRRISDFLELDDKDTLLIVYYAGHARRALQSNEASLWFANRANPTIAVPSGGIQSMLEEADADVLLLFDCCHSATVPTTDYHQRSNGVVEVIAACGYETTAPEVDQHSFTKALTETLAVASKGPPFSIGELHARVLSRLKCWTPNLLMDMDGNYIENAEGQLIYERQPRRTPIYSIICENKPRRSILLAPLPILPSDASFGSDSGHGTPSSSSSSGASGPSGSSDNNDCSSRKRKREAEDNGKCSQILLAIRLEQDTLDIPTWLEWIRNLPTDGKDIYIEGRYDSFSTLLLLRISVAIWNLLPENPAYSFVSFVTSGNKLAGLYNNIRVPCPCGNICSDCNGEMTSTKDTTQRTGVPRDDGNLNRGLVAEIEQISTEKRPKLRSGSRRVGKWADRAEHPRLRLETESGPAVRKKLGHLPYGRSHVLDASKVHPSPENSTRSVCSTNMATSSSKVPILPSPGVNPALQDSGQSQNISLHSGASGHSQSQRHLRTPPAALRLASAAARVALTTGAVLSCFMSTDSNSETRARAVAAEYSDETEILADSAPMSRHSGDDFGKSSLDSQSGLDSKARHRISHPPPPSKQIQAGLRDMQAALEQQMQATLGLQMQGALDLQEQTDQAQRAQPSQEHEAEAAQEQQMPPAWASKASKKSRPSQSITEAPLLPTTHPLKLEPPTSGVRIVDSEESSSFY